jgi:hypothetical protein
LTLTRVGDGRSALSSGLFTSIERALVPIRYEALWIAEPV